MRFGNLLLFEISGYLRILSGHSFVDHFVANLKEDFQDNKLDHSDLI